ncbi:MAG: Flp family type IVb pilin [Alphaproteobacteria bacterium]|nr:Flp family type IVb pilin [Alphaproteobacteria bacterium]
MSALSRHIKRFAANQSGATAVEYGLIVSLIFLAVISAVQAVAGSTISMYAVITGAM